MGVRCQCFASIAISILFSEHGYIELLLLSSGLWDNLQNDILGMYGVYECMAYIVFFFQE